MNATEKENFTRFLQILTDTGNITHALTESGWDHPSNTDGNDQNTIDLTGIPHADLHHHISSSVTLPPAIKSYIDGSDDPLTIEERHNIGIALEAHYKLPNTFCIVDTNDGDFFLAHNHE